MRPFEQAILRSLLLPDSRQIYEREVLVRPVPDLYHYTTREGLVGILKSRTIWASECRSLNDASELAYAEKVIREALAGESANVPPEFQRWLGAFELVVGEVASRQRAYVSSFCELGDRLEQWRGYASAGFCIRFRGISLENLPNWLLTRVVYDPRRQRQIVRDTLAAHLPHLQIAYERADREAINRVCGHLGAQLSLYAPSFKNPSFETEHEWRGTTGWAPGTNKTRISNGRRIPYIEIALVDPGIKQLPIAEVIHAPSKNRTATLRDLRQILEEYDYPLLLAKSSEVPLRV